MALDVYEGFDHYTNPITDMLERSGLLQWQMYGADNAPTLSFVTGVDGMGKGVKIVGVGGFLGPNAGLPTEWLVAVFQNRSFNDHFLGIRFLSPGINNGFCMFFYDTTIVPNPTCQFTLFFNPSNYSVVVYRGLPGGGIIIYQSENNVWAPNVWNFLEVQPTIGTSTSGSIDFQFNTEVTFTTGGVNNQSSPNALWDAVGFTPIVTSGIAGTAATFELDDLYYANTTAGPGSYPNDAFLGDVHVYTQFAIGNDQAQWTPLANTNWQEISEPAFDGDLSYNFTAVAGKEDRFNFAPLETTINKILALQVTGGYRKDDAGARVIKQAIKSNTTEVYGSNWSLPDGYVFFTDLLNLDPDTAASWDLTGANGISVGYNLVS